MEKRADERARGRLEGLDRWMDYFRSIVVFQHVMKVLKTLHDHPLMVIIAQPSRMYAFVILVQRAPHIWIGVLDCSISSSSRQIWPSYHCSGVRPSYKSPSGFFKSTVCSETVSTHMSPLHALYSRTQLGESRAKGKELSVITHVGDDDSHLLMIALSKA